MTKNKKKEDKFKRKPYKLLTDFDTSNKKYKKGEPIQLTLEGAAYLRTINKIE